MAAGATWHAHTRALLRTAATLPVVVLLLLLLLGSARATEIILEPGKAIRARDC
jgi:hypothetical protein